MDDFIRLKSLSESYDENSISIDPLQIASIMGHSDVINAINTAKTERIKGELTSLTAEDKEKIDAVSDLLNAKTNPKPGCK